MIIFRQPRKHHQIQSNSFKPLGSPHTPPGPSPPCWKLSANCCGNSPCKSSGCGQPRPKSVLVRTALQSHRMGWGFSHASRALPSRWIPRSGLRTRSFEFGALENWLMISVVKVFPHKKFHKFIIMSGHTTTTEESWHTSGSYNNKAHALVTWDVRQELCKHLTAAPVWWKSCHNAVFVEFIQI